MTAWLAARLARRLFGRGSADATGGHRTVLPTVVHPRAGADRLVATWVGHSTFLIQIGGLNILTDPVWGDRASPFSFVGPRRLAPPGVPFDTLPVIDIVLLSHDHYDHLDRSTVRRISECHPEARWYVPLGLAGRIGAWGVRHIVELDWWERVATGEIELACTPAQHFSGRGLRDRNESLWCGWCLRVPGCRVFFAGDTALHPEFGEIARQFGPFNLVMLPIGAYAPRWFMRPVHMDPGEAVKAYRSVRQASPPDTVSVMASMHWGTFKLADEPMSEPPSRMLAEWKGAGLASGELWIPAHGESREISTDGLEKILPSGE